MCISPLAAVGGKHSWLLIGQRDHMISLPEAGERRVYRTPYHPLVKAGFVEPQHSQAASLGSLGSSQGSQIPQRQFVSTKEQHCSSPCSGPRWQWWPGSTAVEPACGPLWPELGNYKDGGQGGGGTRALSSITPHSGSTALLGNMNLVFGQVYSALRVLQLWVCMSEEWVFFLRQRCPDTPEQIVDDRSSTPITAPLMREDFPSQK